jgi:hypothetical protein
MPMFQFRQGIVERFEGELDEGDGNTSHSSTDSGRNPGIPQESDGILEFRRNSGGIDRIPPRFRGFLVCKFKEPIKKVLYKGEIITNI